MNAVIEWLSITIQHILDLFFKRYKKFSINQVK